jgi:ATP-dependent RNA helicase RhlE
VINFDIPNEPESYVHRIGRTGRAGADGIALSFCASNERVDLRAIETLIGIRIPVTANAKQATPSIIPAATVDSGMGTNLDGTRGRSNRTAARQRRSPRPIGASPRGNSTEAVAPSGQGSAENGVRRIPRSRSGGKRRPNPIR